MGFRPMVADELRIMDARLFRTEPMGLAADFARAAEVDAP
jgi:acyl CoA:acetate/3-ketoacid CoA transferase